MVYAFLQEPFQSVEERAVQGLNDTMKPATADLPPDDLPNTENASAQPGVIARAAAGAIAGTLIGLLADPFTAIVGAATCAVLSGSKSEQSEADEQEH